MSLAALRNVYNPLAIKSEEKQPLQNWTESVPVVLLSDALKIVGKKHGIVLYLSDDGRQALHFMPALPAKAIGSARWNVVEQITAYFLDAAEDLKELITSGKLTLPTTPRRLQ
jgi:hypothetical protein